MLIRQLVARQQVFLHAQTHTANFKLQHFLHGMTCQAEGY